ncbi:MAG TPA: flagellar basal-body rod protein FlgG [Candidatus Acidoferrum sp.]|jgi:flagellar basal-body rod protein FlgG|nr:flagellar basal-body rod protein FlgG [Candidatus Acidoferrum sp.]
MDRAMYTAASGMETQQTNLDNIANNLANANTSGFRRRRVQFQDLIYQSIVAPGAAATQQTTYPTGLQIGLGARSAATEIIGQQGDLNQTGNPLDLAIQGQGFFQIQLPSGEIAYTRSGEFHLDQTGIIVDAQGNQLQPAITIPPSATNITIGSDGTVSVQLPGQQQAQQVGSLQLATFANPGGLSSAGNNYFLETTASGNPIVGVPGGAEGLGTLQQGFLENSNVDVVGEFIQMILAQRSYEANSRVVHAADQMFQTINGLTT